LRQYLAAMCEAIRSTGSRAPIAAATTGPREAGNAPVTDSPVEAVTYAFHTGVGFPTTPTNDTQNLLIQTGEWDLAPRFQAKAKLSSGFEAPGMAEGVWMYPALARTFRFKETQMLPLSQYDTRALAPLNLEVPSHYLNLWHTPEKTVSFMIGGEAARWLARRATNLLTADDQVFAPFAVSFSRNAALMCAEDCYMQARPTDWRPLPLPTRPKRIVAVGSTPFWEYPGTGIVLFQDQGETATLRVYPDVLKSQRLRVSLVGTLDEPLTRLQETEHPFQLKLEGWTSVSVQRQEAGRWVPLPGTTANVLLRPGTYRLVKRDTAAK
jgi:hypothetical protein